MLSVDDVIEMINVRKIPRHLFCVQETDDGILVEGKTYRTVTFLENLFSSDPTIHVSRMN